MAGLFDIASSGIQAYREALAVTGQNIANIDTEGYRRRGVKMSEIAATQNDINTISDQVGLGVLVSGVERAFDSFIAGRARDASSDFSQAEAYRTALDSLETTIAPGDYDLGFFLNGFFDGLNRIAQSPGDLPARTVALTEGAALANGFVQLANGLSALRETIFDQATLVADDANALLVTLQNTQKQLISSGSAASASNTLLDARDKTIAEVSDLVGLSVSTSASGAAEVTLGNTGNGPLLGSVGTVGSLAVKRGDDRLVFLAGLAPGLSETQQVTSGRLAGLGDAYESVSDTIRALDTLAAQLANEFNTVHAQGVDMNGMAGGLMFSADGCYVEPSPTNLGAFTATLSVPKVIAQADSEIRLVFDAQQAGWLHTDSDGTQALYQGTNLQIGEISVAIAGTPADGDEFTIRTDLGSAAQMRFLLEEPQEFAAAGLFRAEADVDNLGETTLDVAAVAPLVPTNLANVSDRMNDDLSVLSATTLRQNGVLGLIPAGSGSVDLFSMGRQDSVSFSMTDAEVLAASKLTVVLDGTGYSFDLSPFQALVADKNTSDATELASLLNEGKIATTDGTRLSDLGLFAAGGGGNLTIAASSGTIGSATIVSSSTLSGVVSHGVDSASNIQVFTREGRQIAGTPLSQSDVVTYLTEANGFLPEAEYRADYINGETGTGYLGMGLMRQTTSGDAVLTLSGAGIGANVQLGTDAPPLPGTKAGVMTLQTGDESDQITVPQGVSAGYIASLINAKSGDTGIVAHASTRFALTDIPNGTVSFDLIGENSTAVHVTATVASASLAALQGAVNARSSYTGITADLSPNGDRLVFSSAAGDDIVLSNISSTGGAFNLTPVDAMFQARAAASSVGGTTGATSFRVGGDVVLQSPSAFSTDWQGASSDSTTDPFVGGLFDRSFDPAGGWQELSFDLREGIDSNEAAPDGLAASAAATTLGLTLKGQGGASDLSVSIQSGSLTDLSSQTVAREFASQLRASGVIPTMTGAAVSALPADGQSVQLMLGAQAYTLTMVEGEVVVTGPEAGRLNAYFDKTNTLQIAATGGVLSGRGLQLSPATAAGDATSFGLGTGSTSGLTGRSFTTPTANTTYNLTFENKGASTDFTITWDGSAFSLADPSPLPAGITLSETTADGISRLSFSIAQDADVDDFRLRASDDGQALGLLSLDAEVTLGDTGLRIATTGAEPILITGSAQSLAKERLSLSGLPNEDLIVIVNGTGARRLAASFGEPPTITPDPPALELRVIEGISRRVEIFDSATGQSLATRTADTAGRVSALGYTFTLNGTLETGDKFYVLPNQDGSGDARNIQALMALSKHSSTTGMGGYSQTYSSLVTSVGSTVRAATISENAAEVRKDAAIELDAEYSGVNLDDEAARLLEQQQAYQALARVLRTAGELLDTLLNSIG